MPSWFWNRKPKEETQEIFADEAVFSGASDLDIEKKWLQLSRVDPAQFEFFYRKYYDTILIFLSGEIRDPEVAQELTNEVFSIALDRLDKFQWQGYSFGAWLFQIARNLRFEELRKISRSPEVPWDFNPEDIEDPQGALLDLEQKDDTEVLAFCIENLSPVYRQVFKAHYWSKLKVREIAVVMDMSESNVKMHLQRGRVHLRRCLLKNGMQRGLSVEKMKIVSDSAMDDEGWQVIGDNDGE